MECRRKGRERERRTEKGREGGRKARERAEKVGGRTARELAGASGKGEGWKERQTLSYSSSLPTLNPGCKDLGES